MKKGLLLLLSSVVLIAGDVNVPVSFKANFTQMVKNTKGKVIKYRGRIIFNSPDTTKWVYNSPTKKEVCSSDGKIVVIDHDLEQASYYTIDKGLNLAKVLSSAKKYKDNIYTTKYKGKLYTVVLNSAGHIEQIAYKDNLDNTVNLIFRNIKYSNSSIPDNKFLCIRPRNYDSIH